MDIQRPAPAGRFFLAISMGSSVTPIGMEQGSDEPSARFL
jgi:hypothetical protein